MILPYIERFRDDLRQALRERSLEDVFFMDAYTWGPRRLTHPEDLRGRVRDAIRDSLCMFAFISPGYVSSNWCRFEWIEMEEDAKLSRCQQCWPFIAPVLWKTDEFPYSLFHIYEPYDIRDCIQASIFDASGDWFERSRSWRDFIQASYGFVRQRITHDTPAHRMKNV
jgi:hypothetical protein